MRGDVNTNTGPESRVHVLRDCDGDNFDSVRVLLHDGVQVPQQKGHHDASQRTGPDRHRGHLQPNGVGGCEGENGYAISCSSVQ